MSKSNDSMNNFAEFEAFADYMSECLKDTSRSIKSFSETLNSVTKNVVEREVAIKNKERLSHAEIDKIISKYVDTLKKLNIELGKEGKEIVESFKGSAKVVADSKQGISAEKIKEEFKNLALTEVISKANSASRDGKDPSAFIKNFSDSKVAKAIAKEIDTSLGKNTDGAMYKLQGFFGEHFRQAKKDLKAFGADLIEGLAANKFVGGALKDTFKLIGLLGASWLSHFGRLGQILGTAFYVAMETAGPLLATLLVKGLGSVIGKGFLTLGNTVWKAASFIALGAGKGLMNLSVRGGGSIAELATAGSIGQKISAVAKVGGALGGGALGLGGAFLAGREAVKDWKSGNKGRATAFGVGAGFLGAGGIAAIATLFTAAAAPFVAPLLAIGAGIAGLTALWKKYGENVKKWFGERKKDTEDWIKEHKDSLKAVTDILLLFNPALLGIKKVVEWIWDILPWGKNKGNVDENGNPIPAPESGKGGSNAYGSDLATTGRVGRNPTSAELLKGKTDRTGHLSLGKMTEADWQRADTLAPKYGSMGEIVNLGQMSKKRAQEVVEADIKAKGSKSFYEKLDESIINKGSFGTDIPYAARGTSQKFKEDMEALSKAGINTSGAKITSAIGTLGSREKMSPHSYSSSVRGHFSSLGTTIDVTPLYRKDGSRITQADLKRAGLGNYWLNVEGDHEHIAMGQLQWQKDYKKEKQKVVAEQHSMDAAYILMKEDEKLARKILKEHSSETPEEIGKRYEEALNKKGIYNRPFTTDKGTQGIWVRETDEGSKVIDYSENASFTEDYLRNVTRNGAGQ